MPWQAACNAGTDSRLTGVVKADDLRDVLREVSGQLHCAVFPVTMGAGSRCTWLQTVLHDGWPCAVALLWSRTSI